MLTLNRPLLSSMLLALACTLATAFSLTAKAQDTPQKQPQIAWEMIDKGAIVIDVRTAEEFAYSHLDNAINIPFELIVKGVNHYQIDKSRPIVVYCRSGRRSGIALQELLKAGYSHTYNGGGLMDLLQYRKTHPNTAK